MKLSLDRRLFNKAYWAILNAIKRFVVIYGGSNSSKSWSNYQALIIWLMTQPAGSNAIVYRKEGSTLRNSVFENLKLVAQQFKSYHLFNFFYSGDKREVVCKSNGNKIIMSGLDDPDKMKSIVGIKRVVLEEADAFTQNDFMELERRFRGQAGIQFIIVFNPVSEHHWIKKLIFDNEAYSVRAEYHLFTIDDNKFATEDDYAALEAQKDVDEQQYRIYRFGEWGIIKAGNPYLLHLKRKENGQNVEINHRSGFYFAFDFNVKNSVTVWQKWQTREGWKVNCIEEIRIGGSEDTDLEAICRILAEKYRHFQIHYSGDASGNNRSALTKGNAEAFKLVDGYLKKYGCQFLTYVKLVGNPRRKMSRFVCNAITKQLGSNFTINEACKELWADIDRVPIANDGDLDKKYCDKHDIGHLLDCLRYFIWVFCFDIWIEVKDNISIPKEFENDNQNTQYDAYKQVS